MKKFGMTLMVIPFIWYILDLNYWMWEVSHHGYYDQRGIGVFIGSIYYVLTTPLSWVMIIIAIVGYLIHDRGERQKGK